MIDKEVVVKFILLIVVIVVVSVINDISVAKVCINPGDTYTPVHIICTTCAPERLPEVKIIDPHGVGVYTSVKDAAASLPGWKILVKNGTCDRVVMFNTSGIQSQLILMILYPGHKPVFDFSNSPDPYPLVLLSNSSTVHKNPAVF